MMRAGASGILTYYALHAARLIGGVRSFVDLEKSIQLERYVFTNGQGIVHRRSGKDPFKLWKTLFCDGGQILLAADITSIGCRGSHWLIGKVF